MNSKAFWQAGEFDMRHSTMTSPRDTFGCRDRLRRLSMVGTISLLLASVASSGCFPAALTARIPPDDSMLASIAESGIADVGEGMIAGSIYIAEPTSPRTIVRWGDMDLSPDGDGREIRYAIRMTRQDRRGVDMAGYRGAVCYPGSVCQFVAKLDPGNYRISHIKLWAQHLDPNDPGSINKIVDYRFHVGEGEFVYLGRLSMVPPLLENGIAVLPIEIEDRDSEDLAAIGFDTMNEEFPLRRELLTSQADLPLSYEPPWQWKMVAAPGASWAPEIAEQ
jgi:hypothetical protein